MKDPTRGRAEFLPTSLELMVAYLSLYKVSITEESIPKEDLVRYDLSFPPSLRACETTRKENEYN